MRILWNGVFLTKNPSQHNILFWKVLNYKVQESSYKSRCSGNVRWCCHLSYNLEECSFERDPAWYPGIFRFIGKKPFGICNVNMFKFETLSQVLVSLYPSSRENVSFQIVVPWNWTEPWGKTAAWGHLKQPHAYLEIQWNCEGLFCECLKGDWCWQLVGLYSPVWTRLMETVYFNSLHTAQVVPAHDLIEENEKHGAGDFHVCREVEVGMSFWTLQCSSLP